MNPRRRLVIALAVALAVAVPTAVLAESLLGFSASGTLTQTDAGSSSFTISNGLPGGFPDGIPGRLTTDQRFTGRFSASDWVALKEASVDVNPHNSFVVFEVENPDFETGSEAIVGVAFGDFEVRKGEGNLLVGNYVAELTGTLTIDMSCAVDPALGLSVHVSVVDDGRWSATVQEGTYESMGSSGPLLVTANGCLGSETATLTFSGVRR